MSKFNTALLAGSTFTTLLCAGIAWAAADANNIPDLMAGGMGWASAGQMTEVPGSPPPVAQDPRYKYVGNNTNRRADGGYDQPTWRYADLNNPNLTQFAKDGLKKANDLYEAGFSLYARTSRCWQPGVVVLNLSPGRTYFIQTSKVVDIIWQRDQIVRHVYMDVPHTQNPKPSWNGESVGHYEGDTLVVDTIGMNAKTFADNFRTPHTEKLHVIERFRLAEDGKKLAIHVTAEDPDTFVQPWEGTRLYNRIVGDREETLPGQVGMTEIICEEGNRVAIDYKDNVAIKPDF